MNLEKYFSHAVTIVLLGLSIWQRSAALSYAVVASLIVLAAKEYIAMKSVVAAKPGIPEETKRQIQDLNARIVTIEHGISVRGF
jgi:hypothetical protein